jgi:hypothetical protein
LDFGHISFPNLKLPALTFFISTLNTCFWLSQISTELNRNGKAVFASSILSLALGPDKAAVELIIGVTA